MGKLTNSQRDEAVRLYRSGSTSRVIGDLLGVSDVAIRNLLRKRDVPLRHRHTQPKLSKKRELELCERYINGESASALAPEYEVSISLVAHILRRHGYSTRPHAEARRTYSCNHNFFTNVDNEQKAYCLGFIAADGYITRPQARNSQQLIVSLAVKDREHLQRLKDCLESNHPTREYDYSGRGKGKSKPYASFSIRSEKLCNDLTYFGIVPAKTHTLRWPNLPDALLRHFLRGYFDGDGHWNIQSNKQSAFKVTSNQQFLKGCMAYMIQACNLRPTKFSDAWHKSKLSCSTLIYGGNRQVNRIYHLLYDDASIYLPRKRERIAPYIL